jgi:uncharacterized protein (DUF1501 family)
MSMSPSDRVPFPLVTSIGRRDLLRGGVALTAAAALPFLARGAALAGEEAAGRVLVVVELTGGNDGLATIAPIEDPAYYRARTTTAIRKDEAIRVSDLLGLHPNLSAMRPVLDAGRHAVVLQAGYPNPNRSHFESMDIWHTGRLDGRRGGQGWLGRAVDACLEHSEAGPEASVAVGGQVPFALEGEVHKAIAFENPAAYRWTGAGAPPAAFEAANRREEGPGTLAWMHRTAEDARLSSERVRSAAAGYRPRATYPGTPLARSLATVAGLVASGLPTKVFYLSIGGFDTHTGQRGRHDQLMRQLGDALAAFQADLEAGGLADRVLVLSFSEFGRRVRENGSQGTDHGAAGPMFLMGSAVRGGLHGPVPDLADLDDGDLKAATDFRAVYATVLERWLAAPADVVLGETIAPAPLLA